jgi:hypothetical protein
LMTKFLFLLPQSLKLGAYGIAGNRNPALRGERGFILSQRQK